MREAYTSVFRPVNTYFFGYSHFYINRSNQGGFRSFLEFEPPSVKAFPAFVGKIVWKSGLTVASRARFTLLAASKRFHLVFELLLSGLRRRFLFCEFFPYLFQGASGLLTYGAIRFQPQVGLQILGR